MIEEEVKAVALVIIGLMGAVAVYPVLEASRVVEPFSELGVLGPYMKIGDYPRELVVGEEFNLYLYVGNHEGTTQYYRVLVKLGDQSMNVSNTMPLDAPVVAQYDVVLSNEFNSTIPITLSVGKAGLNQRLVFELYKYDVDSGGFVYHQRWNQLWLNVTSTR